MTADQCQHMRSLLGMHALHRLDPAATAAVQAHLDGCRQCRTELRELRGVAGALRLADPDRVTDEPAGPPTSLRTAVFTAVDHERRRQRVGRTARLVAAAAAVLIVAVGVVVVVSSQRFLSTDSQPVAFTTQPAGVHASASVENRNWGTSVALDVTGLPQGQRYAVWLERPDGSRMPAGSFIAGGDKKMSMQLAVGLPMSEAAALGVSTPTDQSPILRAPLHS
ncbi:anti-sigma factor [Rhodococcus opacus]|uniref:anti-sigma factor n=1 Tax=Rhodococcus opacus TaxID=37919 RepID=UPI0022358193|nr:zf-HC2 domain-containing protein [Rhodococcus opacus]UZG60212.1 zf-HC2 domain-containing protein [Rhodococcus opacus]